MYEIILESGPGRGRRFKLSARGVVGIGRDERCGIRLEDRMVSRIHCVLQPEGTEWRIDDRKSRNSTYVNDVPVRQKTLQPGDLIQVGDTLLSVATGTADPLLGATVAGYRINARLGRGMTGTVYRAVQISLERDVALKILSPVSGFSSESATRFLAEARAAARLNHPNVAQVHDAGKDGEHYYMSMEYLEGGSVEEKALHEGPLELSEAVTIAIDAARALAFAEESGIVHRDVKPGNLLLTSQGTAKLCDLGIALDVHRTKIEGRKTLVGSPRYMAPEQATGEDVDHRADIYALGSTLYRMLAGTPPFDAASFRDVLRAKVNGDPEPISQRRPEVPPRLAEVLSRMLARHPADRFASAVEVEHALERVRARLSRGRTSRPRPTPSRPLSRKARSAPASPAPRRIRVPRRRSHVGLVAGSVAVVAVGALGLYVFSGQGGPEDLAPRGGEKTSLGMPEPTERDARRRGSIPEAPPAVDRDLRTDLGQLAGVIRRDWAKGTLERHDAEARLAVLLGSARTEDERSLVNAALEAITQESQVRAEEAAAAARAKVDAFLSEGRFADALQVISDYEQRFSDQVQRISPVRRLIAEATTRIFGEARREVDAFLAKADFPAARARVDALSQNPLFADSIHVAETAALVDETERSFEKGATALEATQLTVLVAIGDGDFERAEQAISRSEPGIPSLESRVRCLERQVRLARDAWDALWAAFGEAQKERKRRTIPIALAPSPVSAVLGWSDLAEGATARFRVLSVTDDVLRLDPLRRQDGSAISCSPLALSTDSILKILKSRSVTGEDALREGLAILLYTRRGPERATAVLSGLDGDATNPEACRVPIEAARDLWRSIRVKWVRKRFATLEANKEPPPADEWNHVAREIADLLVTAKAELGGDAEENGDVDSLGDLFVKARVEALRTKAAKDLFHAKSIDVKDDTVRLTYDFSTQEQLEDFVSVGLQGAAVGWDRSKKLLVLNGEARLLQRNPFRDWLGVSATVVKLDAEAPNVNVALWTQADDSVTMQPGRIDLRRWRAGGGDIPKGYLVFGMGYLLKLDGLQGLERFVRGFLPTYLREPSIVLLSAASGGSLHETPKESLWARPAGRALKLPTRFEVEMKDGAIRWTLNRRRVPFLESRELREALDVATRSGSVTLLTNGHEVAFASMEVWGRLDPLWVTQSAKLRAQDELERLTGKKK